MKKTLYGVVNQVGKAFDEVAKYTSVNKEDSLRRIFEEWAKVNRLVSAVIKGETTFSQEYENVLRQYRHNDIKTQLKASLTSYEIPQDLRERLIDLESCIGDAYINRDWIIIPTKPLQGLTRGTGSGLALSLIGGFLENRYGSAMSRREFFKITGLITGVFALIGGMTGTIGREGLIQTRLSVLEESAKYLDNLYTRLYKK